MAEFWNYPCCQLAGMSITTVQTFRLVTGFGRYTEGDLNNLTLGAIDALTGNPRFPTLPVSLGMLSQYQSTYQATRTEARKGGTDRTQLKKAARRVLEDALVKIALFIQGEARHDYDALLSSGFEVMALNRRPVPLDRPAILTVFNNVSGQLRLRGQAVVNARAYQVQGSTDGGQTWFDMDNSLGARFIMLTPTIPGTIYTLRLRAVGGSTKYSAWSDPITIMAT